MMSALTLGASAARADEGQRPHHGKMFGACKADVEKFCKDTMGNHEAMRKCMQEHANDLSDAWHKGQLGMGVTRVALLALTGLLSWTLTEYLLHRYVYHEWHSFLSVGHALHHQDPQALIGIPWYLTTIIVVAAFA